MFAIYYEKDITCDLDGRSILYHRRVIARASFLKYGLDPASNWISPSYPATLGYLESLICYSKLDFSIKVWTGGRSNGELNQTSLV